MPARLVELRRRPPRIYLCGRHLHHGRTGEILVAVGLLLLLHDRRDWPFHFIADYERYER